MRLTLDLAFVTDGLEAAIVQARDVAGDGDVTVMGGGDVIRQCVDGGQPVTFAAMKNTAIAPTGPPTQGRADAQPRG